jgi:hypothetical protein
VTAEHEPAALEGIALERIDAQAALQRGAVNEGLRTIGALDRGIEIGPPSGRRRGSARRRSRR